MSVSGVVRALSELESELSLLKLIEKLSVSTQRSTMPVDPHSEEGLIYRVFHYRNEVVHRSTSPFHFALSKGPEVAYFWIDPRGHDKEKTTVPVIEDLDAMYQAILARCEAVMDILY